VVPLSNIYRVDGSASKFGGSRGAKSAILLRVGKAKFGYSLEASAPPNQSQAELKKKEKEQGGKSLYKKGWNWVMGAIRGRTDWGREVGANDESLKEGERRLKIGVDKDCWYLDRRLFDQLIPIERN